MTTSRSLTAWHDALVAVVGNVKPRTTDRGLGNALVHDRAVGGDRVVAQRRFGITVTGAVARGVTRPGGTWVRISCLLRIEYLDQPDHAHQTLAMLEDAVDVVDALANPGAWEPEVTRIRVVGGETPTDIAVVTLTEVTGGRRVEIRFPVEVQR